MTLRLYLFTFLVTTVLTFDRPEKCLTGYMTDVQSWVDADGDLTSYVKQDEAIDLSKKLDPIRTLIMNFENHIINAQKYDIKYLSLAKCKLERVPKIFHFKSLKGELSETLQYLTLYGNNFVDISATGDDYQMSINATQRREVDSVNHFLDDRSIWTLGFENITFANLKELDLRACGIQTIGRHVFKGMRNLQALYLGENCIYEIGSSDFYKLTNLVHLDLSRNSKFKNQEPNPLLIREGAFKKIINLRVLDMSFTMLHPRSVAAVSNLGPNLQTLSLCWSSLPRISDGFYKDTSIRQLDLSGNFEVLDNITSFRGLENSLQVLYAEGVKLKNFDIFNNLRKLKILKLTMNEIVAIKREVALTLTDLQVLDLDKNRFATWLYPTFFGMRSLRFLSLRENNINVVSLEMMNDIRDISYIAFSGNLIICNCHTRELVDAAAINERCQQSELLALNGNGTNEEFNMAVTEYNNRIMDRMNISYLSNSIDNCNKKVDMQKRSKFLLLDYEKEKYSCMQAFESKSIPFIEVKNCLAKSESYGIEQGFQKGVNLLLLLIMPGIVLPVLLVIFMFRRRIRYFFVTMKNSATLSLISNNEVMDDAKIYNYDVFVSYCHEDRAWMLDHLLPHLETDCSVSVCLHERDFQVGLSILENIVSCMDRSRTIMLIISRQFLMSQWCQFEMHLAQHRLLETRREDLTLILLEEIPRRLRPNTLHYLMLTKTYIVWPRAEAEQAVFWRRLNKSVVTQKNKLHDNVTLA
ncbi:toll-like receptor 3 isoform X1 [Plodia interpunctella]|uniref:toll-like receptor 3 isoform X1 n=1 Tax=Plodia interpunctella TaxID=58824 RepID=UPI0023681931|nr:toll-like receptor 3 isoform X1 [Plodia interpunctella]